LRWSILEEVDHMFSLTDYDYELPESRIAQTPASGRDRSGLLLLNRKTGALSHHTFYDILEMLSSKDILVVNNTEVIPARLFGKKNSGGKVEILLLEPVNAENGQPKADQRTYRCLVKASKPPKPGTIIFFSDDLKAEVVDRQNSIFTLIFFPDGDFNSILHRIGHVPLPPYIKRPDGTTDDDRQAYQTVYASHKGAVAAPTAGLHFTEALLDRLAAKGVRVAQITLHVGYGTFLPVKCDDIRDHKIHSEWYAISREAANLINQSKAEGGRVVAVGTTSVRSLEDASNVEGIVAHGSRRCDLFIYPGYAFKVIDAMITNFHLPKSTLLMLVCAFAGRENVLKAYAEAVKAKYRFYSYGDAMFIA
jgi:S-adenosylmethionine:tRNA ribosyltransferase-isomerase